MTKPHYREVVAYESVIFPLNTHKIPIIQNPIKKL